MASLILMASVGLAMEMHYCGGEIQSIGIYTKAQVCDMGNASQCLEELPCHQHGTVKNLCCSTDASYTVLDGDVQQHEATVDMALPILPFFYALAGNGSVNTDHFVFAWKDIPIPPLERHIVYQQFLI